jgi:hypothetical protein
VRLMPSSSARGVPYGTKSLENLWSAFLRGSSLLSAYVNQRDGVQPGTARRPVRVAAAGIATLCRHAMSYLPGSECDVWSGRRPPLS